MFWPYKQPIAKNLVPTWIEHRQPSLWHECSAHVCVCVCMHVCVCVCKCAASSIPHQTTIPLFIPQVCNQCTNEHHNNIHTYHHVNTWQHPSQVNLSGKIKTKTFLLEHNGGGGPGHLVDAVWDEDAQKGLFSADKTRSKYCQQLTPRMMLGHIYRQARCFSLTDWWALGRFSFHTYFLAM